MKAHTWFEEHVAQFAIGALEANELAAFREHLVRCQSCRDAVAQAEHDLRWLPMGTRPAPVPPGLVRRLATGVLERPKKRQWLLPAALAASLIGAAGVGLQQYRLASTLRDELTQLRDSLVARNTELAATLDTLGSIRRANRVMRTQLAVAGQSANVVVFESSRDGQWTVVLSGLPAVQPGEQYGIWFRCEKGMRQGATLKGSPGSVVLLVPKPTDLGAVLGASITVESEARAGGMPLSKREIGELQM